MAQCVMQGQQVKGSSGGGTENLSQVECGQSEGEAESFC